MKQNDSIMAMRSFRIERAISEGISHELNNHMTAVVSSLDLLEACANDHREETQQYGRQSAQRACELLSAWRNLCCREALACGEIDLEAACREVFPTHEAAPPLWIRGGERLVRQILSSAAEWLKYSGIDPGKVLLKVRGAAAEGEDADRVWVTLAGPGVECARTVIDFLDREGHECVPRKGELRLLMAAWNLEALGGRARLAAEGKALEFEFVRAAPRQGLAERDGSECVQTGGREFERILLVDDDEMVRLLMRSVLSFHGYHVAEAENGAEAVASCRVPGNPIDLVIIDRQIPGMDGLEAVQQIREARPGIRVILSSGAVLDNGDLGIDATVAKPYQSAELLRLVREVLDRNGDSEGC